MDEDEEFSLLPNLARYIGGVLTQCKDRGMEPPYVLCAASSNGSIYAVRYFQAGPSDKLSCEELSDCVVGSGFEFPVNIMIVDQTGEAVCVKIDQSAPTFH